MNNENCEVSKSCETVGKSDVLNSAFNMISERVDEALSKRGFKSEVLKPHENIAFKGDDEVYDVVFDKKIKMYELRFFSSDEDYSVGKHKSVSKWLFDSEKDGMREAQAIAEDFYSSLIPTPAKSGETREVRRRKKEGDNNVDTLFFINRIANIFTELKADVQYEKNEHDTFRAVMFTREKVNPVLREFLNFNPDKTRLKKLGNVLSDMYHTGNLDVRGLITTVILTSIDEKHEQILRDNLSDELNKMWTAAKELKGKTIKPEKVKKRKSFMADTLLSGK